MASPLMGAAPRYLAVVRRGERELYRILKDYLEARGVAEVVWDRRTGDRRLAAPPAAKVERRRSDRRGPSPGTQAQTLGFFLTRRGTNPRQPARA